MRIKRYLLVLLLLTCTTSLFVPATAQDNDDYLPLPNDLIFTSSYEVENDDGTVVDSYDLVLLDGETMTYKVLGEELGRPISWSPQGDRIAVGRFMARTDVHGVSEVEACVITIADANEVCMNETTELHYYTSELDITWSHGGNEIYFVARHQETIRLLETDVSTGETLRIIYEMDYLREEWEDATNIGWSRDLSHIVIGVGPYNRPPGILVDLETLEVIDLNDLLRSFLDQTMGDVAPEYSFICSSNSSSNRSYQTFSPLGNYLVGVVSITSDDENRDGRRYVVFDTEGNLILTYDIYADSFSCPVWSEDESRFYLTARNWRGQGTLIYQYSLEDDEFTQYSRTDLEIDADISPSSDETHMVFPGYNIPTNYGVYVLYPDGIIRQICPDGHSCNWPVWRPNNE